MFAVKDSDIGLINSLGIKNAFVEDFPNEKLIHASRNSKQKIHLVFDSADAAVDTMHNWNKDAEGKRLPNALIIKRVDTGISDETLAGQLYTENEKVTIRHFIKNRIMPE